MKNKFWGYCLCMIGSAGYYGYYKRTNAFLVIWGIIFIVGIVIIAYNNNRIHKLTKSRKVFWDSLFVIGVCLIPRIPSPQGLSILSMIVLGSIYAIAMKNTKES